jgi:Mg-chelatase subunit ChlD
MRLSKGLAAVLAVCILLMAFFGELSVTASNEPDKITYNRYNIMLVADASGSMNNTDKRGLRFEAIGKFVALLAERGNRVGTVVFNSDIASKLDLADVNCISDKGKIISNIQNVPASGYTNIGKALQTAVDMLNKDKNPDLPSIILLLSDGNTELKTKEEEKISLEQKADAIQAARDAGYKIYTISLNADGTADSKELSQIANATAGQFQEVKKADDLEYVFSMYYTLIFSSKLNKSDVKIFKSSGEINDTFEIPNVGVEEVNIILSGKATDYSLTDPSGKEYSKVELVSSTYSSDTYNVIKIADPLEGTWNYSVKGIPGDKIQINIVYNTNLSQEIKTTPQKDTYLAKDKITITTYLTEAGQPVQANQYDCFTATLSITDGEGNTESKEMSLSADGYSYEFVPQKRGTYTVRANIVGQDYNIYTDDIKINVDNTPPIKNMDIEETVFLWPFSDNKKVIDLSPCATDLQDSSLVYRVESSAFMDNEYTLQGNKLTITNYSLSKGSFTIFAYDSDGAYCTFEVTIKTVNVTLLAVILLIGGILIALAIIGGGLWVALNKRFMGSCYVTQFDEEGNYYEEIKREKGRGRILLSAFNLKNSGFNTSKCYFQATGKDYVFFCTNVKVHGDGRVEKKFRIDGNGYEVTISTDEQSLKGIRIKFVSRLNNTKFY